MIELWTSPDCINDAVKIAVLTTITSILQLRNVLYCKHHALCLLSVLIVSQTIDFTKYSVHDDWLWVLRRELYVTRCRLTFKTCPPLYWLSPKLGTPAVASLKTMFQMRPSWLLSYFVLASVACRQRAQTNIEKHCCNFSCVHCVYDWQSADKK